MLGFITVKQGNFIVRNEFGLECQRFYLHYYDYFDRTLPHYIHYGAWKYTFKMDYAIFFLPSNYFIVMPEQKNLTYMAFSQAEELMGLSSFHFIENVTKIWILGGRKSKYNMYPWRPPMHDTAIIDLE